MPCASPADRNASARATNFNCMLVREFVDGIEIDQVLLVREVERRQRRDGGEYLRVQVGDRTGSVCTMIWDDIARHAETLAAGSAVHIEGRFTIHPRFGPQINLRSLDAAPEGSYTLDDLL